MPSPRRILVVKLASLGDLLTATPALRALRATFPDAHIGVLTTPASAPALRGLDSFDQVLTFDKFAFDRPSDAARSVPHALGLAGDVFLMLPDSYLLPGIAAFLGGHLAYAAGFRFAGFSALGLLAGLAIVVATASLFLHRVLGALHGTSRARLRNPVIAYAIVISLMTVSATASGNLVAAAGGLLFFYSDVIFAWYRFVKPVRWGQPVNIVMYQAGQALLVLSLAVAS